MYPSSRASNEQTPAWPLCVDLTPHGVFVVATATSRETCAGRSPTSPQKTVILRIQLEARKRVCYL
jgi:hypothetical protein